MGGTGQRLLDDMAAAPDIPGRFVAAAAMVRHLLTDPVLPDELLPADWPGARAAGRPTTTSPPSCCATKRPTLMEAT